MNLTGKKVRLRLMTNEDTDRIVFWRNQPRVWQNFIYQKPFTKEGHEEWIRTMVDTGKVVQFIMEELPDGRPVGSVYLRDINADSRKAEYGIFIGEEDALGKGYATQAARLMISYAFEELALHTVFLRVFADNAGARRSYERAGFCLIEGKREMIETEEGAREMVFYKIEKE